MVLSDGKALREVFGEAVTGLANLDPRIVVLDGDVGNSTRTEIFEAVHPERFLQMGAAEQNILGVAAGLATVGFVPIVSAFACFVVGRAFDSIRVLIAQPGLNVKIAGGYAGLLTARTGKTHQMFNDVAIMRTLPNVTVLAPADEVEARQVVRAMVAMSGPAYVQITREASAVLFSADYHFEVGRSVRLCDGSDVTLVSTGVQTTRVFEAADILRKRGIEATVLHVPTIKPIDEDGVFEAASATGMVVVVEEQTVLGGLGGAVAEVLSARYPVAVRRLGIQDCYGESGSDADLLEKYRLSARAVADDVELLLSQASSASRENERGSSAKEYRSE